MSEKLQKNDPETWYRTRLANYECSREIWHMAKHCLTLQSARCPSESAFRGSLYTVSRALQEQLVAAVERFRELVTEWEETANKVQEGSQEHVQVSKTCPTPFPPSLSCVHVSDWYSFLLVCLPSCSPKPTLTPVCGLYGANSRLLLWQ